MLIILKRRFRLREEKVKDENVTQQRTDYTEICNYSKNDLKKFVHCCVRVVAKVKKRNEICVS